MHTPRSLNHIGISVPDIQAATAWYRDVLGCYVLVEPGEARNDGSHFGNVVKDIFGERFESVLMAHLTTQDGVGIEFFQFKEPANKAPKNNFEYERHGIFHFCLTAPDIEVQAQRIADAGGKQLSKVWTLYANKDYKAVYCQDPWGTVIELCTHPYSQFWSNLEPPINL
ncbi:VOC family protein [Rhodococcus jostii]|uniref:VOC family protein n=1 Tax=Rhodococcus jostii TaxID=132919 RepID=A0ABU4CSN2_RHOJO|nr:VOC family protein [Rhodococcus jostii]MDV6286586.1 VOC family protein [Rhodococcus jostii]